MSSARKRKSKQCRSIVEVNKNPYSAQAYYTFHNTAKTFKKGSSVIIISINMLSCWMTFIQYADLNRNKLILCTSEGALQGAAPPTFPLLDSVLSLFQLLIRYLGRGLDIKINAHISEVRASILIRKCSTAGRVSSPRPPPPDRTTRGCTGG